MIWLQYESIGSLLRRTHLGIDHFLLDSYKKMRVFLAVQIMSQSTRSMIIEHCKRSTYANIEEYQGLLDLFDKVDRLVDICNARDENEITKSKTKRNIQKIDHPKHKHLYELFDVLSIEAI